MASRFDYQCDECNNIEEVWQSIKDEPLANNFCSKCQKTTGVTRLISSSVLFHFKGKGFHTVDYDKKSFS